MNDTFPTSFPVQNTHRVVLFSPDRQRTDFKRLQDLGADATGALRSALRLVPDLSSDTARDLWAEIVALQDRLDRRDSFSNDALAEMAECLERLRSLDRDEVAEAFADHLRAALTRATRVADLIAADQQFSRIRWNFR